MADTDDDDSPANLISGWVGRARAAGLRFEAAENFLAGYEKLYEAALDDGSPDLISRCRRELIEAFERTLDHEEAMKRMVFLSHGVDPDKRHKRFTVKDVRA